MPAEERFRPRLLRDQLGAALAVIFFCGILAQGREGSTSLMIPPRHRPYFENISSTVSGPYYHIHGGEAKPKSLPFSPVSFVKKRTVFRRDAAAVTEEQSRLDPRCHQFSIGNPERREFYSPYYPNPYPSKVDCVRILTAGPGELIKLDFRDQFDLEYHLNCSYDYLEVRDGGHGYNKRIGAYCGNTFPDMIYSSSRYLWLRFNSDDTIEGKGFAAVYEVIPSPTDYKEQDECNIPVFGYEGWVNSTDINQTILHKTFIHNTPIDCTWKIEVREGWKVQLYFKKFDLDKPNDCDINFVDIFSPTTDMESRINMFCSSMADLVTSKNNVLYVRFYADWKARNSSFSALFTAFRESKEGCDADEFDCQDTTCILKELECNGNENCRFRWDDDDHCLPKTGTIMEILMADHIIIILVIFCLILSGMCFTFIFNCVRKLVHDHRIIQEHMRQSRASRLDQVGKSGGLVPPKSAASGRSRSNSSSGGVGGGSLSPHHLLRAVRSAVTGSDTRLDNESGTRTRGAAGPEECYVPGAGDLMPILIGANRSATVSTPTEARPAAPVVPANGDAVFLKDTHHTHDTTTSTDDDMVTREQQDQHPSFDMDDDDDMEMATFPAPEMRDNECQTRESLFMNTTSSERSMTPPPPPPPAVTAPGSRFNTASTHHSGSHHRHHRPTPVPQMHGSTVSPFSTFGYTQHHQHQHRGDSSLSSSRTIGKDFATLPHHHHHHTHQHSTMSPEAAQRFRAEAVIEMEHKPHHHHARDGSSTTTTTTGGLDGSTVIPPPPAPPTTAIPPPPPPMGSLARPFSVESTKSAPDVIVTH